MKKIIFKIVQDRIYILSITIMFIVYLMRVNYIKQQLFNTIKVTNIKETIILIGSILGASIIMGSLLFVGLKMFMIILNKCVIPTVLKIFDK